MADRGGSGPVGKWRPLALGAAAAVLLGGLGEAAAHRAGPAVAAALPRLAGVALATWALLRARPAPGRASADPAAGSGWLLLGAAAGTLAAALAAAFPGHLPGGGAHLAFEPLPGGGQRLVIDGGLREELVAPPSAPALPIPAPAPGRGLRVLMVGFPNGEVLSELLARRRARVTVLEGDTALVEEVARRWPALAEARADGRVRVVGGNPRRALARLRGKFALVVVGHGWSSGARLGGALNARRDPRLTVEAFRGYLGRLSRRGYLLVRVAGTGRAVSTLREAAGDDRRFPEQVTVIGRVGGGRSQLWYRAAGLADGRIALRMGRYARGTASLALYRPRERTRWNFYYPLVTGARPKGLAFSTPLDLSPVRDDRPFFDHAGRMLLAPTAALLPDEPGDARDRGTPRIVPPGDRAPLLVLAAALAALLAGGLLLGGGALPAAFPALAAGVGAVLALDAIAAWSELAAPGAGVAAAGVAAALAGAGAGWLCAARRPQWAVPGLLAAAAACAAAAAGAYPLVPELYRLAPLPGAAAVLALSAAPGLAWGVGAGAAMAGASRRAPAASVPPTAWAAAAGAAAWAASPLLAASLGYRAHWALGAAAAAAALRGCLRRGRAA